MGHFIFVMRPMPFGHGAFSFRHGAFRLRPWGAVIRSHLSFIMALLSLFASIGFLLSVGLVGYVVCVLRTLPFAGRTCRTRETSRTFDFQEGNA